MLHFLKILTIAKTLFIMISFHILTFQAHFKSLIPFMHRVMCFQILLTMKKSKDTNCINSKLFITNCINHNLL